MHLALMQPYLFPYAGYFGLIDAVDVFVLFDNVQYQRRGWMHRNRIQHPADGWRYVGVPVVKAPQQTAIRDIQLKAGWRESLWEPVSRAYRGRAEHADEMLTWLSGVLDMDTDSLHELNAHTLQQTAAQLGLRCRFASATDIELHRDPALPLWDWARAACGHFEASVYLNPPGGESMYPPEPFRERGLGLGFIQPSLSAYERGAAAWEPGLSILDVMAHCGVEGARAHVCQYDIRTVAQPRG